MILTPLLFAFCCFLLQLQPASLSPLCDFSFSYCHVFCGCVHLNRRVRGFTLSWHSALHANQMELSGYQLEASAPPPAIDSKDVKYTHTRFHHPAPGTCLPASLAALALSDCMVWLCSGGGGGGHRSGGAVAVRWRHSSHRPSSVRLCESECTELAAVRRARGRHPTQIAHACQRRGRPCHRAVDPPAPNNALPDTISAQLRCS
jgi:hypothetical protein